MALWGGRFSTGPDQAFKQFNDSLPFDYQLAEQDIEGSIAWAGALEQVGILTAAELEQLVAALNQLLSEVNQRPQLLLESDAEAREKLEKAGISAQQLQILRDMGLKITSA